VQQARERNNKINYDQATQVCEKETMKCDLRDDEKYTDHYVSQICSLNDHRDSIHIQFVSHVKQVADQEVCPIEQENSYLDLVTDDY
jgi:hypothetical protein